MKRRCSSLRMDRAKMRRSEQLSMVKERALDGKSDQRFRRRTLRGLAGGVEFTKIGRGRDECLPRARHQRVESAFQEAAKVQHEAVIRRADAQNEQACERSSLLNSSRYRQTQSCLSSQSHRLRTCAPAYPPSKSSPKYTVLSRIIATALLCIPPSTAIVAVACARTSCALA